MQKSIQIDDFGTKNIIRSDSDFFIFVNELVNIITNKKVRPKKTHFSFKFYYFLKKLTMSVKASSSLSLNVETGEVDDDAAGAGAVNAGATG